ncbi:hypothetical protein BGZ83_006273 [Gryganskiella cystojenkinii]|nr:hypothetical protein BGZ83_006273 [Gryganskiella cystojenkinii]
MRNLVLEGLAERWGDAFDPSFNKDLDDIYSYYVEFHKAVVIILEKGDLNADVSIIGCGILLPLPAEDIYGTWCAEAPSSSSTGSKEKRSCRMMRVSVAKDCRGQGHAKAISQDLTNIARRLNFERILIETNTEWTSAVGLYRSLGFRVVEANEHNVHFELDL